MQGSASGVRSVSRHLIMLRGAVVLVGASALTAPAGAEPRDSPRYGVCNAYNRGRGAGLVNKRAAPPFVHLKEAAEAEGKTVAEYCAGVAKPDKGPKTSKDKGLRS